MYKKYLALDNLKGLICHKNAANQHEFNYSPTRYG